MKQSRWREPILSKVTAIPVAVDLNDMRPQKAWREHEVDVVLQGHYDGHWFYPTHRVGRHFIDGVLTDTQNMPLEKGDVPMKIDEADFEPLPAPHVEQATRQRRHPRPSRSKSNHNSSDNACLALWLWYW
jgi:hypothetical protein